MQRQKDRHSTITSYRLDDLSGQCLDFLPTLRPTGDRQLFRNVIAELLNRLEQNLPFDHLSFSLHDPAKNVVRMAVQAGHYQVPQEVPVLKNSLGIVLEQQQPLEVQDVASETRFPDLLRYAREGGFGSFRVVPLSTETVHLGAIGVARKLPGSFSPDDIRNLDHAAQLVALVLENMLMADVLQREKSRMETLLDVNSALISSLDIQELFKEVSASIRRTVQQDYTHLALYDKPSDSMRFYILDAGSNPALVLPETLVPMSHSPAGIAFRQGETMRFSHDDMQLIGSKYTDAMLQAGVRSICCFPLLSRGRKLGTLGLASLQDNAPSEHHTVLLTQIAAQVAVAVDNARAYDEIAKYKEKLAKEKSYLEDEIRAQHNFGEVVGNSHPLREVLKQVEIAAPTDANVLVLGETGTGKELIARAVHRLSSRRESNFIKLNCAAIPTGLLESELFGHEKGAFTGAISQKVGRLELADKGTLFLDEIGEIPAELQPKLLRVLQDHEFERLGSNRTIRVNVRLIAATNRDLAQAVADKQFRTDLFYRLNVFPVRLPPLRERPGDIPLLVRYFVQKFARRMGKKIESIPAEIIRELEQWHWPGNIRELENFIERSVILTQGPVFFAPMAELRVSSPDPYRRTAGTTLEDVEREYILRTLRASGGVIAGTHGAAARLGMKRTTLQSRMQKLGITREEYET
ncbi:MAG TPA: sigma 54-interacting transcriptional regulator [Terriglobales bacterium]